jgi:hypothetical protein
MSYIARQYQQFDAQRKRRLMRSPRDSTLAVSLHNGRGRHGDLDGE